jgi:hypothetical protein
VAEDIAARLAVTEAERDAFRDQARILGAQKTEWLCEPCKTIHPWRDGDRFTAACPCCGTLMVPTSVSARALQQAEARLAEVRDTVAGFLAHHGNASIASLRFAQDLAHGILQVCDKNTGTGDAEAVSVLAADRAAVIDALKYTITHAGGEAPKKRYVEALTRRGEQL